jgi:hypothetical protein
MPDNVRHPHSRDPDEPQRVPPHREGQTTPQKAERRADQQPHERDESSASQQGAPSELMKQAGDDVERGLVDTSRAEATDATYRRELRPEPQAAHESAEHRPGEDRRLDTSGRPGRPADPDSATDKPAR